jgi:hypothetical protein
MVVPLTLVCAQRHTHTIHRRMGFGILEVPDVNGPLPARTALRTFMVALLTLMDAAARDDSPIPVDLYPVSGADGAADVHGTGRFQSGFDTRAPARTALRIFMVVPLTLVCAQRHTHTTYPSQSI